jgi:hypothetical protein
MMLSIISLAVALFALFVNVAGLVRRPRIVAKWGYVVDQPPEEGLSVIVTARRRPIEVDEIAWFCWRRCLSVISARSGYMRSTHHDS